MVRCKGGSRLLYVALGRIGFRRNIAYRWSHLINVFASAIFGFIYIALWQVVAPVSSQADPYTRATMTSIVILAQVIAWVSIFLPNGLGIHLAVRTGAIALEMARPVPYFPMVLAREAGNALYQGLYRALPLVVIFWLTIGFPPPASAAHLAMALLSTVLASYICITVIYTVGIASLWTIEARWTQWLYHSVMTIFSGGWLPSDILPGVLGKVVPYLPFACQAFYPIRIYLGLDRGQGLLIQLAWAAVLTLWCQWLTRKALRRVTVQGG